jgi:hypothetical protein
MYGSLLTEADKRRRVLLDGVDLLYLYLVAATVTVPVTIMLIILTC